MHPEYQTTLLPLLVTTYTPYVEYKYFTVSSNIDRLYSHFSAFTLLPAMTKTKPVTPSFFKLLLVLCLTGMLVISDSPSVIASIRTGTDDSSTGYSVLKLLLEDEQHLTTIRRAKMIVTFDGISNHSSHLIDMISDSSEQDLEALEKLAMNRPVIQFEEFSDDAIGKATLDSLRMTTAKEFFFRTDDFEKDLLLSQLKVLRLISHLAQQLELKETNKERKVLLKKMSDRYEKYYQQVNALITITTVNRS
jgi:ATP-dependent protease HslVU (ClpYQ) peptidase subunit